MFVCVCHLGAFISVLEGVILLSPQPLCSNNAAVTHQRRYLGDALEQLAGLSINPTGASAGKAAASGGHQGIQVCNSFCNSLWSFSLEWS